MMTLIEARSARRENLQRKPVNAEDAALRQELDDVLAVLIWKLASPGGTSPSPAA
jgi:hypothetical protein